jgi:hypothetical protein
MEDRRPRLSDQGPPQDRRRRLFSIAVVGIAAAVLLAAAVAGVWWSVRRAARQMTTPTETAVDIGDVVTQVREMSRLETAAMHVINVSTITQSYKFVPKSLGNDEITLYAEGDVIAGIDLSRVQQSDVWREPDGALVLRLPDPQVLITRVDNAKTRVMHRNTGLLRRADSGLESRVRLFAEGAIRGDAMRKGILDLASQNGETKLAAFLHTLGFRKVRFVGTKAPPQRH